MNRRQFLTTATAAGAALSLKDVLAQAPAAPAAQTPAPAQGRGGGRGAAAPVVPPDPALIAKAHATWCMYSRHLQFVATAAQGVSDPEGVGVKIGEHAHMIGVGAVNLTFRNGGHVLPANGKTCLPPMLKGIRSTGIICNEITPDITPAADPNDTAWLTNQTVVDRLSLAADNGIKQYRIDGPRGYPPNSFGKGITDYLDGYKVNTGRLVEINKKYSLQAVMHTQSQVGLALWDMMYVWKDIDPKYIGYNYCVGHVTAAYADTSATGVWANTLRWIMPYMGCVALQDYGRYPNADGTLSGRIPHAAKGQVNWVLFFRLLREAGYNGLFDTQEEFQAPGADGSNVSFNAAWFSDNAVFTSGRMTPALAVSTMKADMDAYKAKATEAGWTAAQQTP